MASVGFWAPAFIGTIGGRKITLKPGSDKAALAMYRPLGRLITSVRKVTAEINSSSMYLAVKTDNPDLSIQVTHHQEMSDLTDGEMNEWCLMYGNFGTMETTEEWFSADTSLEDIATRVDFLVQVVNDPEFRAQVQDAKAPKRKAPSRKASKATEPVQAVKPTGKTTGRKMPSRKASK